MKAIVSQALFFERRARCATARLPPSTSLKRVEATRLPRWRESALDLSEQQENKKDHQDQSDHA